MPDAADFAKLFFDWSQSVDDYRDEHFDELSPDQQSRLKDFAHQLDDISDHFTIEDIDETLQSISGDLDDIAKVTTNAKAALKRLQTIEEVTKVIAAVVAIGVAAETGNIGTIEGSLEDLGNLIPMGGATGATAAAGGRGTSPGAGGTGTSDS